MEDDEFTWREIWNIWQVMFARSYIARNGRL
ncbi:hypothetical protein mEp554_96 [Escherichia phage mEp554]